MAQRLPAWRAMASLALPVMDYTSEPPPEIIAGYRTVQPPFDEVFCSLLPMALTHGLQLYWQQQAFAHDFARIKTVVPWIQYVAFCLSGKLVTEISGMACQIPSHEYPRWRLFVIGETHGMGTAVSASGQSLGGNRNTAQRNFWDSGFRGAATVLAGVHDSNANYLRYLAAGQKKFTLLSTGTWIIGFDTETKLEIPD